MTTFEDRQKKLFNQLNAAEKQANFVTKSKDYKVESDEKVNVKRRMRQTRAELRQFRGKESIFKRPEAPLPNCLKPRVIPDFRKNPNKWVCYSMENVPDISENSNAEAAAICKKEIDKEIDDIETQEDGMDTSGNKIVFRPPIDIPQATSSVSESKKIVEYKNSIIIYPEHVVGQKEKKRKIKSEKTKICASKTPQLRLEHLLDEDDDDIDA